MDLDEKNITAMTELADLEDKGHRMVEALAGLGVTSFAFLGVNMFLSGLHSYGEL